MSGELTEYFNFSPEVGVLHSKNTDPMCPWGPYPYEYITFPSSVRYLGAPATLTGYDGSASFNLKVIVFNEEAPLIAAVEDEDEYNRLIEIADSIDINALEDIDTEDEAKACSILTMNSAMWLLYLGVSASPENPLGEPVEFYAQGLNLTEFFFEKVISDTNGMMPFMGNFGKITLAETSQIKAIDGLFISEDSILYGIYDSAVFTSPGRDGFIAEFDTAAAGIKGFADSIGIGIDVHFAPFMESTDGERKFLITFAPELKRVPSLEITDINSLEMWYYPAGGDYKTFLGNAEFIGKDINWYSDSVIDEVELGNGIIFGTEDTNFDDYTIGAEYETECIAFTPTLNGLHIKTLKLGEGAYAYRSLFGGETYSYHSAEPGFRLDELVLTKDFKNIIEEYLYHPGYLFGNNRFGSSEIIDITPLKLTVEEGLTRIPSYLFGHPEAGSATGFIQEHTIFSDIGFPSTLKEIGDYAFYDAEFANENVHMIIPENVETIGNHAFYRAKLKSIYLPAATSLGDSYSITSGIKIYRSDDYTLEEYAAEVGITIPEGFTGGTLVSNT